MVRQNASYPYQYRYVYIRIKRSPYLIIAGEHNAQHTSCPPWDQLDKAKQEGTLRIHNTPRMLKGGKYVITISFFIYIRVLHVLDRPIATVVLCERIDCICVVKTEGRP